MGRSVLAVLAAPVVWGLVMLPVDFLLQLVFPDAHVALPTTYLIVNLIASVGYSVVAGAVSAWIAGRRAVAHGVGAGLALFAVGLMVQLPAWDLLPIWYHLGFLVMLVPACVAGAAWVGEKLDGSGGQEAA